MESHRTKQVGAPSQLRWSREQQKTFDQQTTAVMRISAHPPDLKWALGFVELAESESATMVRGSSRFARPTGMWWEVHGSGVKRLFMSVAKMVAAGNRMHLDSKGPRIVRPKGDVIPLRKAGNVFVINLWVRSPEVYVADDGQTIRPVRSEEGVARGRNVLILEEWRMLKMAKRNVNSDHMQR